MYDLVIKLLNEQGKLLTGWLGRHAYPIKWSLYSREATKSELSSGIIPMECANLKRIINICE